MTGSNVKSLEGLREIRAELSNHLIECGLHGQIRKKLKQGPADPTTTMTLWKLCLAPLQSIQSHPQYLQNYMTSFTHHIFSLPNLFELVRASDMSPIMPYVIESLCQENGVEDAALSKDDEMYILRNLLALVKLQPSKNLLSSVS
jgi:hypothetical protein